MVLIDAIVRIVLGSGRRILLYDLRKQGIEGFLKRDGSVFAVGFRKPLDAV
jgi:hypothetical protein